jgi:hypothetical protein
MPPIFTLNFKGFAYKNVIHTNLAQEKQKIRTLSALKCVKIAQFI